MGDYDISVPELPQKKIPGVKFICRIEKFVNQKPKLDPHEHDRWRWYGKGELSDYEFIPGVAKDIEEAMDLVEKLNLEI